MTVSLGHSYVDCPLVFYTFVHIISVVLLVECSQQVVFVQTVKISVCKGFGAAVLAVRKLERSLIVTQSRTRQVSRWNKCCVELVYILLLL